MSSFGRGIDGLDYLLCADVDSDELTFISTSFGANFPIYC